MVREFKLINEKGQEYSLMDIKNYCLLTEPDGLGYAYSTEYEQLGNTFISNLREIQQGTLNGTLNFLKYDNYKKLVDFIEQSESLKFSYKIPFESGVKEYFKDVQIQSITKAEKQPNGIISEQIIFDCLSLWYEEKTEVYNFQKSEDNIIRWDFKWNSRFSNFDTSKIDIVNNGHISAPILLEIDGRVINPVFELWVEEEKQQEVEINTTIEEFEKLLYCTKENEFFIRKQKTNGTIEDLFDLDIINFSNDNVIRIPKNKSCRLVLSADNEISSAKVTVLVYYKAI